MILNMTTTSKGFAPSLFFFLVLSILDSNKDLKYSKSIILLMASNGFPISDNCLVANSLSVLFSLAFYIFYSSPNNFAIFIGKDNKYYLI